MREPAVKSLSVITNRFCRSFVLSEAIRSCLDLDILPARKRFPRRFARSDMVCDRYQGVRIHLDPQLGGETPQLHSYERLIQKFFWKGAGLPNAAAHEPELYVTGPVGSGKSTFVDYYLRYYCPEEGELRDEFEKKLVVYFDARGLENQSYASQAFFDRLVSAIAVHCKDHGLSIPHSNDSGKRSQDALKALSDFCSTSPDFRYLVLVLDNLDNCTVAVQKQVIHYVNDIRKYTDIVLWRVIIPLWPTTFSTFAQSTEALTTGKPRIHLGPPLEPEFIQKRLQVIKDRLVEETRISVGPKMTSSHIPVELAAEFSEFVDFVFERIRSEMVGKLIRQLSSNDLRRELWLWEGILRSGAAESIFDLQRTQPDRKFEYEWIEALLAGDARTRPDEGDHRIANLFLMHHDSLTSRDLLAGFHGCYLLKGRTHRRDWFADMVRLGYRDSSVLGLEQSLRHFNMLHPVPEKFSGEDFEVHSSAVDAYLDLASNEAYVDNVAMSTPVDEMTRSRIRQTSGHANKDVVERVTSTIAFIEFVMRQEQEFVELFKSQSTGFPARRVEDLQWLHNKSIPSIANRMARRYLGRVKAIRELVASERQLWWSECEVRLREILNATRETLV